MENQELISMTVVLAGRPYPIRVLPEEEAIVRRALKEINDKVNHFQLTYPSKDKIDCLSMTLLTYAVDTHRSGEPVPTEAVTPSPATDDVLLFDRLSRLETLIDEALSTPS